MIENKSQYLETGANIGLSDGSAYGGILRQSMVAANSTEQAFTLRRICYYEVIAKKLGFEYKNPKQFKRRVIGEIGLPQPLEEEVNSEDKAGVAGFVNSASIGSEIIWIPADGKQGGHIPKVLIDGKLPDDFHGQAKLMEKAQSKNRSPMRMVWQKGRILIEIGELGASAGAAFNGKGMEPGQKPPKILVRKDIAADDAIKLVEEVPWVEDVEQKVRGFMARVRIDSFGIEAYLDTIDQLEESSNSANFLAVDTDYPLVDWGRI
ncbi:MAG: hypothetical protein U0525_03015 [Patescibacteria group bacterium]